MVALEDRCQQCIGCGVMRPLAWYSINKATDSGREARCRLCRTLIDRQRKEKNQRERESQDPVTQKWCSMCTKTLPASSYNSDGASKDGLQNRCKECNNINRSALSVKRLLRSRNQTLVVAGGTEQVCFQCHVKKPWGDFLKCMHRISGISTVCKQCYKDRKLLNLSRRLGSSDE